MQTFRLFVASSSSLATEREAIESYVARNNDKWVTKQIYLELTIWEKYSKSFSVDRKQDQFNRLIEASDIFIVLVHGEVGQFTSEEFEFAFKRFQAGLKPRRIVAFFSNKPIPAAQISERFQSVLDLKKTIKDRGQIWCDYDSVQDLISKLRDEIDDYFETQEAEAKIGRRTLAVHTTLDILDAKAHLVSCERRTHFQALREISTFEDSLQVDGEIDVDSLSTDPDRVSEKWWEGGRLEIRSVFPVALSPGTETVRTLNCNFIDAFKGDDEYWIEEQVTSCRLIAVTIRFPHDRPPRHCEAVMLRDWYSESPASEPMMRDVLGRKVIQFQDMNQAVGDRFKIAWAW